MLSDWWNGIELWVLGLAFPLQFALVMVVLVPLCLVVAYLIDRVVDHASALFGSSGPEDRPIRSTQATPEPEPAESDEADEQDRVPAASAGR